MQAVRPKDIEEIERIATALDHRKSGLTYRQIGARMNCSESVAHSLVRRGMARLAPQDAVRDVMYLELERLDSLHQRWWQRAMGLQRPDGSYVGAPGERMTAQALAPPDAEATEQVLKIMERRARLLGLDSLTVSLVQPVQMPPSPEEDLERIARELMERREQRALARGEDLDIIDAEVIEDEEGDELWQESDRLI